ncbi:MAG: single-stranded-DNA-specific exonuclease RecJ [Oscillospiraceae bacterium]|nr:single-stranded-DNA-specific exonuclease RecJ [Oscillospiraceae bacterium]
MPKRWKIGKADTAKAEQLERQGGITQLCAKVLAARGVTSVEAAQKMLDTSELSDPFLLTDMQAAADRILAAVENEERICVYGDYDCDGVTSTVMLTDWLSCAGADVIWYIPTRTEGYGMREDRIRKLAEEGVNLIVTVDNGISAIEEAKLIRSLGMELVVTDHHRPGDELPEAAAVVDPYRPDDLSPYKTICGAGVVLKLIAALDGGETEPALEQFGDLAALATIADVMPLDGENRFLVRRGLELLANTERMGLIALMAVCGIEEGKPVSATAASFQLIPRINAAGRFASASLAAKLFLTDDPDEAQLLAGQIHALNQDRRETEQVIFREILDRISADPSLVCQRVLVFAGENWHHGVIGIVAARLLERFGKPCFLMSREPDGYRGSARGFGDFSVFECLRACSDHLIRYGGHPGAGGFTVSEAEQPAFCAAIQRYAAEHNPVMPVLTVHAEGTVSPQELTVQNVGGLSILEPFGEGNEKPLFVLEKMQVGALYPLSGGAHTKLQLRRDRVSLDAVLFRMSPEETGIQPGAVLDFLVSAEVRQYNGNDLLSLRVEDWRVSETAQEQAIAAQAAYESWRRGEELPAAYYQRMCPHRADLVAVYKAAGEQPVSVTRICTMLAASGMNRCRARVCADIFSELGLMRYDAAADTLTRLPVREKRELTESKCYLELLRLAGGVSAAK